MADLRSQHLTVSEEVQHLTSKFQVQEVSYFDELKTLVTLLEAASLWATHATSTLDQYCVTKEERWKEKEKDLLAHLCLKATSIFQMGFNGMTHQFSSQGYPPPGTEADFLDVEATLMEYPLEAFEL